MSVNRSVPHREWEYASACIKMCLIMNNMCTLASVWCHQAIIDRTCSCHAEPIGSPSANLFTLCPMKQQHPANIFLPNSLIIATLMRACAPAYFLVLSTFPCSTSWQLRGKQLHKFKFWVHVCAAFPGS